MSSKRIRTRLSVQEKRRRRARILTALSIANAAALALIYVAEVVVAERHWLTTLITYMPQQPFAIPGILLIMISLVSRNRRAIIINGATGVFFFLTLFGWNVPLNSIAGADALGERTVRLMTHNVHHSEEGGVKVADLVSREEPDVLCIQEANPTLKWSDSVNEIQRVFPKWHVFRTGGLAVVSRFPMKAQRLHQLDPRTGRLIQQVSFDINGRRLTVINVHLPTAASAHSLTNRDIPMSQYMAETGAVRSQNSARVMEIASTIPGPLVIAGDFNTPPRGMIYRRIARQYTDAFRAAGWGTGFTYRSSLPVLRIDYIFARPGITVKSARTLASDASDHRPLIAELVLPE